MKNNKNKKVKGLFLAITLVLAIIIAFSLVIIKRNENTNTNIATKDAGDITSNNSIIDISNSVGEEAKSQEEKYVDENNMEIGLYVQNGDTMVRVHEYYCDFTAENVMGLFYAIPSNEEEISCTDFRTTFLKYYGDSTNSKIRIGYNIEFTLDSGEYINQTVLNPDDAYLLFPKVQCYLYDDINLIEGRAYYHITQDIMNDDRICSSIKLVGDKNTKNIVSSIRLTVFTFDSDDDFTDTTRKYRGNSSYTVSIYEE